MKVKVARTLGIYALTFYQDVARPNSLVQTINRNCKLNCIRLVQTIWNYVFHYWHSDFRHFNGIRNNPLVKSKLNLIGESASYLSSFHLGFEIK